MPVSTTKLSSSVEILQLYNYNSFYFKANQKQLKIAKILSGIHQSDMPTSKPETHRPSSSVPSIYPLQPQAADLKRNKEANKLERLKETLSNKNRPLTLVKSWSAE